MSLSSGTRLGPYEISSPLGSGGMGEVYRARDTRLDRSVAIKVLPDHLASNPELRQRFEREARAISNLSHPHVCTLHDIGHHDGIDFIVMELIEGETLSDRLIKGPLPGEQALTYAIQIADALDKAHRAGIVHRDLKPGNIMLAKSGAKLLDFGLARLNSDGLQPGASFTSLPTERRSLTGEGTILGTFQYMAPEQLEGREADARTDIFAFGAVVYEMATGKKAFNGSSQASLIGAILHTNPPPISTLQPMCPRALDRVVKTCLAKDPDDRWQSARDLMNELKWISEDDTTANASTPIKARRTIRELIAWIAAAVLLIVTVVLIASLIKRPAPESSVVKFEFQPPEKLNVGNGIAISPDGKSIVFVAVTADSKSDLWLRALDTQEAQKIAGTEDARFPFWSPDSRSIGFFSGDKMKKVSRNGGPPVTICGQIVDPRGASWSRDGYILYAPTQNSLIFRISVNGGTPAPVTAFDESRRESSHRWPLILPDGRHYLFFARTYPSGGGQAIWAGTIDSPDRQLIREGSPTSFAYAPSQGLESGATGYLLFGDDNTLLIQPFDANKLKLVGDSAPLIRDLSIADENGPTGYAAFSISDNGVMIYMSGGASKNFELGWFDRTGKRLSSVGDLAAYHDPALSPDGQRLSLTIGIAPNTDVWMIDLVRNTLSRFTFSGMNNSTGVWSPDGKSVAYCAHTEDDKQSVIYIKPSGGGGKEQELVKSSGMVFFPDDWSPDGQHIIYETYGNNSNADLWVVPTQGNPTPVNYLQTRFNETHAHFSPDGKFISYSSDESGKSEVYVQPFPPTGARWQVSTKGGDQGNWGRDGKELFYVSTDKKLMVVPVSTGSTFEAGAPSPLFELHIPTHGITDEMYQYSVSPDSRRFLVVALPPSHTTQPVGVVLNWNKELKN
jgi:eukaryotic-like serine/threonine-protein kinase